MKHAGDQFDSKVRTPLDSTTLMPLTIELRERAIHQLEADFAVFFVNVARGEALRQAGNGNSDFGGHAMGGFLKHRSPVTPGQKLGVIGDVGDQCKHFGCAVPDQNGLVNGFHTIKGWA